MITTTITNATGTVFDITGPDAEGYYEFAITKKHDDTVYTYISQSDADLIRAALLPAED